MLSKLCGDVEDWEIASQSDESLECVPEPSRWSEEFLGGVPEPSRWSAFKVGGPLQLDGFLEA